MKLESANGASHWLDFHGDALPSYWSKGTKGYDYRHTEEKPRAVIHFYREAE